MITDPRVFEDAHLPRSLEHREGAVETLTRALEPVTRGRRAEDILIHGPSGVGKTVLARHTLGRLEDATDDVDVAHVHALGSTTGDILRDVLHDLHASIHLAGNEPVADLVDVLDVAVERPLIVILDEADDVPSTDILEHLLGVPLVSAVAITHDAERWLARVDDDRGRAMTELELDRYGVAELADILEPRAQAGLRNGAVRRDQLVEIADEVAGVARNGIQSLFAAAEIAQERDHRHIEPADIDDCYERARRKIRRANLASLPVHHHILYALLYAEEDWVRAGALYERYDALDEELYSGVPQQPIGERARRNKLAKLAAYDLVETCGEKKGTRYRVVDPEIEPVLDVPGLNQRPTE